MKHTIKLLTMAFTLAAILTLTGCPGPVTPDVPCTHENKKTVIETAATCTETGLEKIICADCGELIEENTIEALGHDFELTEHIIATCTECEKLVAVCKVCKTKITNEKPALGHSYGNWTVTKEANCTEKGSKKHTCTRCGEEETVEIDALGHDYQGGYCENCKTYKFENRVITRVYTSTDEWQKVHMQSSEPIYDECHFSFETNSIPTNLNELIHLKIKYKGYKVQEFITGGVVLTYTEDIENEGVDITDIKDILLSQN